MNYRPFRVGYRMHRAAIDSLPILRIRIHFDSEGNAQPNATILSAISTWHPMASMLTRAPLSYLASAS